MFMGIQRQMWGRVMGQSAAIMIVAAILGLAVNQVRPDRLALVADWSPQAQLTTDSGDSLMVPFEEAEMLFQAKAAVFLDARSGDFYQEGHIRGALHLPPEELDQRIAEVLTVLPRETTLIAYCDGETCNLSKDLAFALMERGYVNVRVLVNGWTLWQERGLPVEAGPAVPVQ
jgi:rhodanese-related sulfurtransferase